MSDHLRIDTAPDEAIYDELEIADSHGNKWLCTPLKATAAPGREGIFIVEYQVMKQTAVSPGNIRTQPAWRTVQKP